MQENRALLRGKQSEWHKLVVESEFKENEEITRQKVLNKVNDMKRSWKAAKDMQQQSGWGLREEDVESSISERLKKRCPFFWELDDLWGERPNMAPPYTMETSLPSGAAFQPAASQPAASQPEAAPRSMQLVTPQASQTQPGTQAEEDESEREFEWSPSQSPPPPPQQLQHPEAPLSQAPSRASQAPSQAPSNVIW